MLYFLSYGYYKGLQEAQLKQGLADHTAKTAVSVANSHIGETGSRNTAETQKINSLTLVSYSLLQTVFTRDSIYAIARICYGNSVCLSVCQSVRLSHGWISQKRLKLGSRNFHHTVAPAL